MSRRMMGSPSLASKFISETVRLSESILSIADAGTIPDNNMAQIDTLCPSDEARRLLGRYCYDRFCAPRRFAKEPSRSLARTTYYYYC